ncbi:MAG: hypothetical protein IPK17_18100 [Chloroflexi bacterium]|uniref:hypothetical protein n=1 Tax=Candidatus Flexifilum breve TaxID=3140694 RepID=UPI003135FC55|nr:hypothetical protein [Chloroflexota bacterium]
MALRGALNGVLLTVQDDRVYVQHLTGLEDHGGVHFTTHDAFLEVLLVPLELQAQVYLLHEF